jgi:hypothetical protein
MIDNPVNPDNLVNPEKNLIFNFQFSIKKVLKKICVIKLFTNFAAINWNIF